MYCALKCEMVGRMEEKKGQKYLSSPHGM